MQGATAEEEGTPAEEDGTAAEAADQEAMIRNEADAGCEAAIQEEVATPKQRGDGGEGKEEDDHHLLEEQAAAADGEGGNSGAGMLGDVFFH